MTIAAIDWGKLFELIWAAALASVAVSVTFAVVIVGATRASDSRRDHRTARATGYVMLAIVAAVLFAASVAYGVEIIVSK
jgi:Kef-type K+ transport system membrane component KefB